MALKLPPEVDIKVLQGSGDDRGVTDVRYFPLTFEKKLGDPSEQYIQRFYKWRTACSTFAKSIGTMHINIMDFDDWGVPKPTVRKLVGECAARDKDEPGFLYQYAIVKQPIMRGAITAMVWIRGDNSLYTFVPNYSTAIAKAIECFIKAGIEPPDIDPSTYTFPMS